MPEPWFSSPGYKEGGKGEESFTLCELLLADISFSWKVSKLCRGAVNKALRESTSQPGWCCFSVPEGCLCFRLVQYPDFQHPIKRLNIVFVESQKALSPFNEY
ncbi:uncharacterized protein LOC126626292 isoform X1 [Malus sylvestris]|uniref:uncharacterized protein LOC126626292 isoform X1 n=1 Tax=Malus sylvestris TaxID=3752 RepID=UPI0010AA64FD|nr:uncharacterized protein LOC108169619 [Malus domestica]XP_050151518.1 uncharacterized protein LOC126626292 isoform X1 [Malus sylvestris]XP_050151519.1 uncharacterized protein LOC126626292 isoform X1 [Malus sylvestris]